MSNSPRIPTREEYAHERLGPAFQRAISDYDTRRRLETLAGAFLPDDIIVGKTVLDVGSGLGFFSERLVERGAIVTACDLGPTLVERTRARAGCRAVMADALRLEETFGRNQFDVVISSECIEHTPDPAQAIRQMMAVLRPGGYLSLSTPNLLWSPAVRFATLIKARPYDGLENFSSWRGVRRTIESPGGVVVRECGLHLFPFQLPLHRLSAWSDRHLQFLRFAMINICVLARKTTRSDGRR